MWLPSLHSSWIRLGFYQEGDEGTSVEPERDVVQDSLAPMTLRLQIKDLGGLMNQLAAERMLKFVYSLHVGSWQSKAILRQ